MFLHDEYKDSPKVREEWFITGKDGCVPFSTRGAMEEYLLELQKQEIGYSVQHVVTSVTISGETWKPYPPVLEEEYK